MVKKKTVKKQKTKAAKTPVRRKPGAKKAPACRKPGAKKKSVGKVKRSGSRLTAKQKENIKAMLLRLRVRFTGQLDALTSSALHADESSNPDEDGTEEFDRDFALQLASSNNDALLEIDEALDRISDGTYGKCEQCEAPVRTPRLLALPFVRTCIRCQSEIERRRSGHRARNASLL